MTKASKTPNKNEAENIELNKKIPKEVYISPEKNKIFLMSLDYYNI